MARVAPSRAPPCPPQAIGCCEHWAGLTAEEVLEEALKAAASAEVAPAVLVAAAAASAVVAPAVEAVTWAVAAVATTECCGALHTTRTLPLQVHSPWRGVLPPRLPRRCGLDSIQSNER